MLALVYFTGIVVFEGVFRSILGQESNLAIVVSTLAIATLFQPLRRYLQTTIDRRFFRPKYDMAQTLQTLSLRLRNELELNKLTADLIGVVDRHSSRSRSHSGLTISTCPRAAGVPASRGPSAVMPAPTGCKQALEWGSYQADSRRIS